MSRLLTTFAFLLSALAPVVSAQLVDPGGPVPVLKPYFFTGYETSDTLAVPSNAIEAMLFQHSDRKRIGLPWLMGVYYENAGTDLDRFARLAPDPTGAKNQVLHFWIQNATIDAGFQTHKKARIQTSFPDPLDASELYSKQRLFLHKDMAHLTSYPTWGDPWWIGVILGELWLGAAWEGDPFPSRINLTLAPAAGKLRLQLLHKSGLFPTVFWNQLNTTFEVPTGEWMTIETGYKMGNATTGRAVVVITVESTGTRTVVFDVTDWTYDPLALLPGGPGPVPATHWNPQKLYTSDNVINHIKSKGGAAQAYWDDFELSGTWPKQWP